MNKDGFFDLLGNIDDKFYDEALEYVEISDSAIFKTDIDLDKPVQLIEKRGVPIWTIIISAAACAVFALGILFIVNGKDPLLPVRHPSESSDNSDNSSSESSETPDSTSSAEQCPITDVGNGMLLFGEPLESSKLEEYTLDFEEPWTQAEEDFLPALGISDIKELYCKAERLRFLLIASGSISPTAAAVENSKWKNVSGEYTNPISGEIDHDSYGGSQTRILLFDPEDHFSDLYFESGYTYESFNNICLSVFTENFIDSMFEKYNRFIDYNGELFCCQVDMGGPLGEVHREYELISKSDDSIKIRRTMVFDHNLEDLNNPVYDPEKSDEYNYRYTDFEFVKTDGGWRIDRYIESDE